MTVWCDPVGSDAQGSDCVQVASSRGYAGGVEQGAYVRHVDMAANVGKGALFPSKNVFGEFP